MIFDHPPQPCLPADSPVLWFQPIVDTFRHRVCASEYMVRPSAETLEAALVRAVAVKSPTLPGPIVVTLAERELMRDERRSRRVRDYLRQHGFALALKASGASDPLWTAVRSYQPDYLRLDGRLTRGIDQPGIAPTIGALVSLAETSGAAILAPGVNRNRIAENLWLLGVRFMQGRLFSVPSKRIPFS